MPRRAEFGEARRGATARTILNRLGHVAKLVDVVPTICATRYELIGRMAELEDATALGAVGETRGGSNPLPPTVQTRDSKLSGSRPSAFASGSLAEGQGVPRQERGLAYALAGWGNPWRFDPSSAHRLMQEIG